MPVITADQCLGARAMLHLKREDLSRLAQVAVATLADFEVGRRQPHPRTLDAIRGALEFAGIRFLDDDPEGPGLRLVLARVAELRQKSDQDQPLFPLDFGPAPRRDEEALQWASDVQKRKDEQA